MSCGIVSFVSLTLPSVSAAKHERITLHLLSIVRTVKFNIDSSGTKMCTGKTASSVHFYIRNNEQTFLSGRLVSDVQVKAGTLRVSLRP